MASKTITKPAASKPAVAKPSVTIKTQANPAAKRNVTTANRQWASRPADERFWNVAEMKAACEKIDAARKIVVANPKDISAEVIDGDLRLRLPGVAKPAALTNWGFQILAAKLGAPARYLRSLPEHTVAELINIGLAQEDTYFDKSEIRVGVRHDFYEPHVDCWTSTRYGYLPNHRVCDGLEHLEALGWRTPPARPSPAAIADPRARKATAADVLANNKMSGLSIKAGDMIAPAGLYASDKDMFAFMVNPGNPISTGKFNLNRGIFVENSEVGAGAFKITTFLYDGVCGNHIVWGASNLKEISVHHVGEGAKDRAWNAITEQLKGYLEADAADCVHKISNAAKFSLGTDREAVVDNLFNNRRMKLTREIIGGAFDAAVELDADRVDPNTAWGMVTGLTRISQQEENADRRTEIDCATAVVMAMVN